MFYVASKIFSMLVWPSTLIAIAIVAGVALRVSGRAQRLARGTLVGGAVALVVCGFSPLGNWLVLPLEQRFPRPALPSDIAGIIILGGFENAFLSRARQEMSINQAGERLTESVILARRLPSARVIFTGGVAAFVPDQEGAADAIGAYLEAVGIARGRLVLEGRSRTTYENALYVAQMMPPRSNERYLLVTSAYHMPRSIGTFRRMGYNVVAWPVDYRTAGPSAAWVWFGTIVEGLDLVDYAFKEWIGLAGYWMTGRTDALWPGPGSGPGSGPEAARAAAR